MSENANASPFCHIVIPAPDLVKAAAFYTAVFNWRVSANIPGDRYWFFQSGNIRGGFDSSRTSSQNSVILVLHVSDMSATISLIQRNGGQITQQRSRIGEASPGYDAYFLDPNGKCHGRLLRPVNGRAFTRVSCTIRAVPSLGKWQA